MGEQEQTDTDMQGELDQIREELNSVKAELEGTDLAQLKSDLDLVKEGLEGTDLA